MRETHLTLQDLESQQQRTLGSQPAHSVTFTCKDTSVSGSVDYLFKMLNFELYILLKLLDKLVPNPTNQQYSIVTVIGINYC